jgi:hypothetical protein
LDRHCRGLLPPGRLRRSSQARPLPTGVGGQNYGGKTLHTDRKFVVRFPAPLRNGCIRRLGDGGMPGGPKEGNRVYNGAVSRGPKGGPDLM